MHNLSSLLHLLPREDKPKQGEIDDKKKDDDKHGLSGWAIFIIVVVVVVALCAVAWFVLAFLRRRQQQRGGGGNGGLDMPGPRPGGALGWINDKIRSFKNRRTAAGAYEGAGGGGGTGYGGAGLNGRRRAALDPDEAWDSRVDGEAYYEEQELGLHPPAPYSGSGYGKPGASTGFGATVVRGGDGHDDGDRGRSRSRQRELDERYDEEMGRAGGRRDDPFGDDAERSNISMRGVSPRPLDINAAREHDGHGAGNSPTERRSMFREAI